MATERSFGIMPDKLEVRVNRIYIKVVSSPTPSQKKKQYSINSKRSVGPEIYASMRHEEFSTRYATDLNMAVKSKTYLYANIEGYLNPTSH
jgi:hypothetical protein